MDNAALLMIVGVVLVPILQLLKKSFGFSGPVMLWFTIFVSFITAAVACVLGGKIAFSQLFSDPQIWLGSSGVVFSTAMAVYGSIKAKLNIETKKK